MTKPRVFVGSSKDGLDVAREVQLSLSDLGTIVAWENDVFRLSEHTLDSLRRQLRLADYGVFILTPDDSGLIRGSVRKIPRDNVLFEAGLFAGRLGIDRTYLVHPDDTDLAIPTDLYGITTARYTRALVDSGEMSSALAPACTRIRRRIMETWQGGTTAWETMADWIIELGSSIRRSPGMGGFPADVVVGLSRGGLAVADLLSRYLGGQTPVLSLWADRRHSSSLFSHPGNWTTKNVLATIGDDRVVNVLVVDDICRRGATLASAVDLVRRAYPDKTVKSAALVADLKAAPAPDYCVVTMDTSDYKLAFAAFG